MHSACQRQKGVANDYYSYFVDKWYVLNTFVFQAFDNSYVVTCSNAHLLMLFKKVKSEM